jgi:hypothetical protein
MAGVPDFNRSLINQDVDGLFRDAGEETAS